MDQRRSKNVGGSGDTSNMRSNFLAPQQMRELADTQERAADIDRNAVRASLLRDSANALRAAADQLEGVLAQVEALRMPFTTGKRLRAIHHNAAIDAVLAILTVATAPQEDRDD